MMFVESCEPLAIRPLVNIGGMGPLVWKQSCGSGFLAVLCAFSNKEQQSYNRFPIHKPGGVLQLSGTYHKKGIVDTRLACAVHFTEQGLAQVEL